MKKLKVLFLIHDLGQGGAEKVLINLVNNLDRSKFDISVTVLFGGGVNEQFLSSEVHFSYVYPFDIPANTKWMKLFTPEQLHKKYIKEHYDIEISYLEGPCARIISGCTEEKTKLVSWIHTTQKNHIYTSFRNQGEVLKCYNRFDHIVCVSEDVRKAFCSILRFAKRNIVLYNSIESEKIKELSNAPLEKKLPNEAFKIIAVGSLKPVKRYDRLLNISKRLKDKGYQVHTYIMGTGPLKDEFDRFINTNNLSDCVTLLGYDTNPYKYVSKCDLFVCSSETEGFSTATTESLIVGTPVCTVDVSGMKEMLGENNEYGLITANSEQALYNGIKSLLDNPVMLKEYRKKAKERGKMFSIQTTVQAVEEMLMKVYS